MADQPEYDGTPWPPGNGDPGSVAATYPPMPASEAEWRTYWAFYRLTVAQRDAAWRELETLKGVFRG